MLITSHYPTSNVSNETQIVLEHVTQTKLQMNEKYYYCRHHVDDEQYYRIADNRIMMLPFPLIPNGVRCHKKNSTQVLGALKHIRTIKSSALLYTRNDIEQCIHCTYNAARCCLFPESHVSHSPSLPSPS